jgi:hypothetical protein
MLWETKSDGLFRVVRLTRRFAFKTPHILNRRQLKNDWKLLGTPGAKPSIAWRWRTWRKLFRENCSMNEREVQTWLEWHRNGEQKISGVGLCPIRYYLPLGLLVVMKRADKVPAGRVDVSHDFLSNGFVSDAEVRAASLLIGRNQDTSKPNTYGLINGHLVVVDGFILPLSSHS